MLGARIYVVEASDWNLNAYLLSLPNKTTTTAVVKCDNTSGLNSNHRGGDGSSGYEWNTFVHVSLRLESSSRKVLDRQYLFHGSLCFQLVVLVSSKRLYHIHIAWFEWFLHCKGNDSTALQ